MSDHRVRRCCAWTGDAGSYLLQHRGPGSRCVLYRRNEEYHVAALIANWLVRHRFETVAWRDSDRPINDDHRWTGRRRPHGYLNAANR